MTEATTGSPSKPERNEAIVEVVVTFPDDYFDDPPIEAHLIVPPKPDRRGEVYVNSGVKGKD
jgi:hypothetical protein